MKQVACIGIVTADVLVKPVDAIPPAGTLVPTDSAAMHVGGCAANAAADLRVLGVPARLVTKLGRDSFGRFVEQYLTEKGVTLEGVAHDEAAGTAVSMVCISSAGERSFLYHPGGNDAFTAADIPEPLIAACGIVFVAGALLMDRFDGAPCAAFLRRCREQGQTTVLDTAWDFRGQWMEKLAPCLPCLDLFLPSYDEAVQLSGERDPARQADLFHARGARDVVIKLGGDGAYFREEDGTAYRLPTYREIKPVDTTGAGDAFCAGLLAGLAQGLSLRESGRLANAVGTHCVTAIGASEGIRPLAQIEAFMRAHPLDDAGTTEKEEIV